MVHGVGITLPAGRVTALVGPNGSGKSTLLRALARLHRPAAGALRVGDAGEAEHDALALSRRDFARHVTLLSQSRPTPAGLTVGDVVGFGRHPHRGRWQRSDPGGAAAIERAPELTSTSDLVDRPVDELSGGQRQRVWLASCLAQDAGVLLLDEPTTYLDLRFVVEMLDLIRDLADDYGVAVGLVLHDLDHAAHVADEVIVLAEGRVRGQGPPATVLTGELLSDVYGIRVDVDHDPRTGALRTRPVGRHPSRVLPSHRPEATREASCPARTDRPRPRPGRGERVRHHRGARPRRARGRRADHAHRRSRQAGDAAAAGVAGGGPGVERPGAPRCPWA